MAHAQPAIDIAVDSRLQKMLIQERQRATYWRNKAKSLAGMRQLQAYKRLQAMNDELLARLDVIRVHAERAGVASIKELAERPPRIPRTSHRKSNPFDPMPISSIDEPEARLWATRIST